jgi:hypothetical protein
MPGRTLIGRPELNIELKIERLVLDGLAATPRERAQIRAAAEAELSRLLSEGGLARELAAGGAVPTLAAGTVRLADDRNPWQLGEQIARAVYEGIGRQP